MWLSSLHVEGLPPCLPIYANINNIKGFYMSKKSAGHKLVLVRNPHIIVKKCSNLLFADAMAANPKNIEQWYLTLLCCSIESPEQIWSGDEISVHNVPAVISHETSTVLAFVNACGKVCPSMAIHKGTHMYQSRFTNQECAQVAATMNRYTRKS